MAILSSGSSVEVRDVALPPGIYAHIQDGTRGDVVTYTGPIKINQKDQDRPVIYAPERREFIPCELGQSLQKFVRADEGDYVVLHNPAFTDGTNVTLKFPLPRTPCDPAPLAYGRSVNIPGPCSFALWPEQAAQVVAGHRLNSNQYLVVHVIDGETARKNWKQAIVEAADGTTKKSSVSDSDFITGNLLIIRGTDTKFFVPCTGLEVIQELSHSNKADSAGYVRRAMSLERLEYCILVDESGTKRYEKGAQVVFPTSTETFWANANGDKKFRAYELNEISGLHVKVIADYKDEDGTPHKTGDELFITGKEMPIYYPRAEHAIIKYGERETHYASAVPVGEGRYVMERLTGVIKTIKGPDMLLCDPRIEVVVRRILSDTQCFLWFPGNSRVADYNHAMLESSTTASSLGYVTESESEYLRSSYGAQGPQGVRGLAGDLGFQKTGPSIMRAAAAPAVADSMSRKMSYTPPRSITLDTKLDGAVAIQVWQGFAVMVVSKTGKREPVLGPNTRLLDYDETLEVLRLSTGKPKSTDHLCETVYLRVLNNKVSDIITVQTADHVDVNIKVSYNVNFEGAPDKWFDVENYVKLLSDHVRSVLKGEVRRRPIREFYADPISIIRDTILGVSPGQGQPRPGMAFSENGMRIIDVDVLKMEIPNGNIARELEAAQHDAVTSALRVENTTRAVAAQQQMEEQEQLLAKAKASTAALKALIALEAISQRKEAALAEVTNKQALAEAEQQVTTTVQATQDLVAKSTLARSVAENDAELTYKREQMAIEISELQAEADAIVKQLAAATDPLRAVATASADSQVNAAFASAVTRVSAFDKGEFAQWFTKMFPDAGNRLTGLMQGIFHNPE